MNTQELVNSFRTWNGNLWFAHHLSFLKGSYKFKDAFDVQPEERKERIKQRPFVRKDVPLREQMIRALGRRQGIILFKETNRIRQD